ncbi:nucleotidyl transferase AbiEii/AbiGii toxin family protein [Pseudomonas aeruginosa]|nr:nucleotidyl transferase AbiEii/AbiGii toxin family protein [Pseudomonas aeruginosa]ELK0936228.1 nucleotidyl transferase AbiEii/AbiGii toxin family protein [Pseudomonas aeruginosa]ELN3915865.1 nucleotidyl transferase AbiEii/AbiGii toxin family protein [Pseudomonas aeruginosa]ELO0672924.1 nucleotidyl transferase AbiEii/AbiGii toxin family protein [Pseudomonas aeruginosa]ELO0694491.1 nucleotidyl transferase AbiEii/AbiGii toxin family protein [Pseudomonas aeruginosa]
MDESFFEFSKEDQREALEYARAQSGRPAHLLEKDIWVVWALNALFDSHLANDLTFKGGTSLSKVYKIIDRFSEDIDLTYDIRKLIPDLLGNDGELPVNRSQANKWTKAVRNRLPDWIAGEVLPVLQSALNRDRLDARIEFSGPNNDSLLLHYPALMQGTGYVAPVVKLEFGGRATGEPHQVHHVTCDIAEHLPGFLFPTASPLVMSVSRTFWEKATAAHVFCAQGRIRGERYARHWHDLAAIARSPHFATAVADREVAIAVAHHKSHFFVEKDAGGKIIDYAAGVTGHLQIVPTGEAKTALEKDYTAMLEDEVMVGNAVPFDELLKGRLQELSATRSLN